MFCLIFVWDFRGIGIQYECFYRTGYGFTVRVTVFGFAVLGSFVINNVLSFNFLIAVPNIPCRFVPFLLGMFC